MEDVLTIYLLKSTILASQIGWPSSELQESLGIELSWAISLLMFLSGSPLHPMPLEDKTYFYTFCFSQLQDCAWLWQTLSDCFLSTSNSLSAKDFRAFLGKGEENRDNMRRKQILRSRLPGQDQSREPHWWSFSYRQDWNIISILLLSWLLEISRFDYVSEFVDPTN